MFARDNSGAPTITIPMNENQCYIQCPPLVPLSIESPSTQGFNIRKLKRPWSNDEKALLAMGMKAWKTDDMETFGHGQKHYTDSADHMYEWLSVYALDNARSPAECRAAIRKMNADVPF